MGEMHAVAVPSVRRHDLDAVLSNVGTSWQSANHITATASLSRAMQEATRRVALPIAGLLDLIVLPARPPGFNEPVDGFPDQDVLSHQPEKYREARSSWRQRAGWTQFRIELLAGNTLANAVRAGSVTRREGSLLLANRRDFLKTISALAAAGMRPSDFAASSALPGAAVQGWAAVEQEVPAFATLRETLWVNPDHVATGRSALGRRVAALTRQALQTAFGLPADGDRRTLVHHGFYFYTPQQWQLFQLLGSLHEVDQVFVVHDDGHNPAFRTWRRFFLETTWQMPRVRYIQTPQRRLTDVADAYRAALTGRGIDSPQLAKQTQVLTYRNPAEFVRHWTSARDKGPEQPGTQYYGAGSKTLARLVRRLDRDQENGQVDLSELPIGSFLLALHRSIQPTAAGEPRLRLTAGRLLDIVASGYLDIAGGREGRGLAALRRSIQFFDGCDAADQWLTRAEALYRLILDEVTVRDPHQPDQQGTARIKRHLDNPLRLLPWADLTIEEAASVRDAVRTVTTLLHETAQRESATFDQHLQTLRDRVERGLRDLPVDQAAEVRSKLSSFGGIGQTVVRAEEVIEVVQIVLGRKPDFDPGDDPSDDDDSLVRPLRSLDSLGFAQSARPLHLANLSESTFPSTVSNLGWPFQSKDISPTGLTTHEVSLSILRTRSEAAGQSDLYLLHLALDGVPEGVDVTGAAPPLTLSWIKELDGDLHDASSLVTVITRPAIKDRRLADFLGGVPVHAWQSPGDWPALRGALLPERDADRSDLGAAVASLDARATAVANACSRRFALQWLLSDTPAYRSPHHHAMLYGNILGMLKRSGEAASEARRLCDDLWRHLTAGERSSSAARAVLYPGSSTADEWVLTLTANPSSYQTAFKAAGDHRLGRAPVALGGDLLAPDAEQFLPDGVEDPEVCRHCPVRGYCLVARR